MGRLLNTLMLCICCCRAVSAADAPVFKLPTDNDALYRGDHEQFYMYCDRWFEGQHSQPWQAGSYGFTRNALRVSNGNIFFTKLHEGIDVKPLKRDGAGEPLDTIHPLAPGVVAYVSKSPGASNYGRYVVIAHDTPDGTIYSLYAHLKQVHCEVGQRVGYDSEIGILGYSGVGLNRVRAHCHVELCLMQHAEFHQFAPASNKHGLFHGHNLIGFNAADALLACRNGKPFSLREYFNTLQEHYRVRVPSGTTWPDIILRHPFLYKGDWGSIPVALEIAFTAEGVPIAIYPSATPTNQPTVISCRPMPLLQKHCTAGRLNGASTSAYLTPSGQTFINRFLWQEPAPTPDSPAAETF